jgi:sugar phosphate isomerase/epimerase
MYRSFNSRALGLDLTADEAIALAATAGFAGVDLLIRDLVDSGADPRRVRARMDDLGLRAGSFPLPVAWRGDADSFARDLAGLPRYVDAAAILGLERTATWVMPEMSEDPGSDREPKSHRRDVAALHVDRLGAIAHVLGAQGVRLGLEVIGVASFRTGHGRPFITRLADLDENLGALRSLAPNVGIALDAYHLYAAEESVDAGLCWGIDSVVAVHLADLPWSAGADRRTMRDGDRGLPGEHGAIDCAGILRRLSEAGYDGPVIAEPMANCRSLAGLSAESIARRVAGALDSVWPREITG